MLDIVPKYPSIPVVWKRDPVTNYKTLLPGDWATPEIAYLSGAPWLMHEKIDGTNVTVHLQKGHVYKNGVLHEMAPVFRGRTDKSVLPPPLVSALSKMFPEGTGNRILEDNAMSLVLYGEGYGKGIQGVGRSYIPDGVSFILFDCLALDYSGAGIWMRPDSVKDLALTLGIECVPLVYVSSLFAGIEMVSAGLESQVARVSGTMAEGVVARPAEVLLNRQGNRIITKIKTIDFREPVSFHIT